MKRKRLSPAERKARAIVGPDLYDSAANRFGPQILRRIGEAVKKQDERRKKSLAKEAKKLQTSASELGLSASESKRFALQGRQSRAGRAKVLNEQYRPVARGARTGYFEVIREGRTTGFIRNGERLKREKNKRYENTIRLLQETGFTRSEARSVVKDAREKQFSALARFKKTKAYQELSPRKKRLYNKSRWAFISDLAIYKLLGGISPKLDGDDSDDESDD